MQKSKQITIFRNIIPNIFHFKIKQKSLNSIVKPDKVHSKFLNLQNKNTNTTKKHQAKRVKRIALLIESDMAFDRTIARGVGDYIRSHKGWIILMDPMLKATLKTVQHWKPDGIIISAKLPTINNILTLKHIPMVAVGSPLQSLDIPVVTSNQEEIGRMAARFYINKGFQHFAFCGGNENAMWCKQRLQGFESELKKKKRQLSVFKPNFDIEPSMPEAIEALGKWMNELPKPCGLFVFFDGWARWVLDACVAENIKVPDEISVLGVDNDRWLCELSQPQLSSVDANVKTVGYVAADILHRILDGESEFQNVTTVDPLEIVKRDSTEVMFFDDPEIAFAMRYIHEHACDPISPSDVLTVTGMSNSTAHRKFKKFVGHSIHSEIQNTQVNRLKKLLTTTNLNVAEAAKQSGFENVRYLTKVFRDYTGLTPTEFRRTQGPATISPKK